MKISFAGMTIEFAAHLSARRVCRSLARLWLAVLLNALVWPAAHASSIMTVNSLSDAAISGDGLCTLREAMQNSENDNDSSGGDCAAGNGADKIVFSVGGTLSVGAALPQVGGNLTIDGAGQNVTIDGSNASDPGLGAIFVSGTATVERLKFTNCKDSALLATGTLYVNECTFEENRAIPYGGAIAGTVTAIIDIRKSTFSRNSAVPPSGCPGCDTAGGAINTAGKLTISDSTFDHNTAKFGGAIYIDTRSIPSTITNCTFVHNSASYGSAIYRDRSLGALTITNSTFGDQSSTTLVNASSDPTILRNSIVALTPGGCSGNFADGGHNLSYPYTSCPGINQDPQLYGLANNGGPTQTMAISSNSPAVGAGDAAICQDATVNNRDQRAAVRIAGADTTCDIGAYESDTTGIETPTPTQTETVTPTPTWTSTETTTPTSTETPTATPTATADAYGWTQCAFEHQQCNFTGTKLVRYGIVDPDGHYEREYTDGVLCSNDVFGDPAERYDKYCWVHEPYTPTPTATATATPQHDSVVLPIRPVKVVIPLGKSIINRTVIAKVRNADVLPAPELGGHLVELHVDASGCPVGTVAAYDLDPEAPGAQSQKVIAAGKTVRARIPLTIQSANFTSFNLKAPARCVLLVSVLSVGAPDPNPSNNSMAVEINVFDKNDPELSATHESYIDSANPVTLKTKTSALAVKKVVLKLGNADYRPVAETAHTISIAAASNCPALTIDALNCQRSAAAPNWEPYAEIKGGGKAACSAKLSVDGAQLLLPNKLSPGRCQVTYEAIGPSDPESPPLDPSNNSTTMTIDIDDELDF